MTYFPETPAGQAAKRQFCAGMAILCYALAATAWPNLIWVTFTTIALSIPVLAVVALFMGKRFFYAAGVALRWLRGF